MSDYRVRLYTAVEDFSVHTGWRAQPHCLQVPTEKLHAVQYCMYIQRFENSHPMDRKTLGSLAFAQGRIRSRRRKYGGMIISWYGSSSALQSPDGTRRRLGKEIVRHGVRLRYGGSFESLRRKSRYLFWDKRRPQQFRRGHETPNDGRMPFEPQMHANKRVGSSYHVCGRGSGAQTMWYSLMWRRPYWLAGALARCRRAPSSKQRRATSNLLSMLNDFELVEYIRLKALVPQTRGCHFLLQGAVVLFWSALLIFADRVASEVGKARVKSCLRLLRSF